MYKLYYRICRNTTNKKFMKNMVYFRNVRLILKYEKNKKFKNYIIFKWFKKYNIIIQLYSNIKI